MKRDVFANGSSRLLRPVGCHARDVADPRNAELLHLDGQLKEIVQTASHKHTTWLVIYHHTQSSSVAYGLGGGGSYLSHCVLALCTSSPQT